MLASLTSGVWSRMNLVRTIRSFVVGSGVTAAVVILSLVLSYLLVAALSLVHAAAAELLPRDFPFVSNGGNSND